MPEVTNIKITKANNGSDNREYYCLVNGKYEVRDMTGGMLHPHMTEEQFIEKVKAEHYKLN